MGDQKTNSRRSAGTSSKVEVKKKERSLADHGRSDEPSFGGGRHVLVTSALPYANGPIHLGHVLEAIQTDIYVRARKFLGDQVYYFCADDTHGTPVMIAARKEGVTPDELVERIHSEHFRDLSAFEIQYDNYYSTNSRENREFSEFIYTSAKKRGLIDRRNVMQLYCTHDTMFLPDRFVKGTCPSCGAADQYGDSCDVCGSTYSPDSMKDARCSICGNPPEKKESEHLFFQLGKLESFLRHWLDRPGRVDDGVRKKLEEWLSAGLRDWDISRDGPYFGFPIPGEKEKYFYVWLDAPIGYLASARNHFDNQGEAGKKLFNEFWKEDSKYEVYHFIGKDIVYFHTLFWPALLHGASYRTPDSVFVHGFLMVNGEKMSKSRGTFIRAATYVKHLSPEPLRYYVASRLGPALDDLDLNTADFVSRFNSDVVGNFTNIFSRLCSGIGKKLGYRLSDSLSPDGLELKKRSLEAAQRVMDSYLARHYSKAIREIAALGDEINRFVSEREPWKSIKTDPEEARQVVTDALTAGRILAGVVSPVIPSFTASVETLLNLPEPIVYGNLDFTFPVAHQFQPYEHITQRIEEKSFQAIIQEEMPVRGGEVKMSKSEDVKKSESPKANEAHGIGDGLISIEELGRVELRVGKILKADMIEGADRLLRIELDVGEGKSRNVIAGIRAAYSPEELAGLSVVCVANLQPRKMKFGTSEAMLLAAGEGTHLTLFTPHREAKPGDRLR